MLALLARLCYITYVIKRGATMLYTSKQRLATDLCYLAKKDYTLLNDIIVEYVAMIDNKRFNDLEDVINTELQSIL